MKTLSGKALLNRGHPVAIFNSGLEVWHYDRSFREELKATAAFLARRLFALPPSIRRIGVAVVLALAVFVSFLPIYGLGHGQYQPVNVYKLFQQGRLT